MSAMTTDEIAPLLREAYRVAEEKRREAHEAFARVEELREQCSHVDARGVPQVDLSFTEARAGILRGWCRVCLKGARTNDNRMPIGRW